MGGGYLTLTKSPLLGAAHRLRPLTRTLTPHPEPLVQIGSDLELLEDGLRFLGSLEAEP